MKRFLAVIVAVVLLVTVAGCAAEPEVCTHEWVNATCERAAHCIKCNENAGTALEHKWADATWEAPKTCVLCGLTEGASLQRSVVGRYAYTYMVDGTERVMVAVFDNDGSFAYGDFDEWTGEEYVLTGTWRQEGKTVLAEYGECRVEGFQNGRSKTISAGSFEFTIMDEGVRLGVYLLKNIVE